MYMKECIRYMIYKRIVCEFMAMKSSFLCPQLNSFKYSYLSLIFLFVMDRLFAHS